MGVDTNYLEPSIEGMLRELDLPVYAAREEFVELHRHFAASMQPAFELLRKMESARSGEQAFVVPALLVRAMNDLIVSFHLLLHGYLSQAYNSMRMAYEASDLLELVVGELGPFADAVAGVQAGSSEARAGARQARRDLLAALRLLAPAVRGREPHRVRLPADGRSRREGDSRPARGPVPG